MRLASSAPATAGCMWTTRAWPCSPATQAGIAGHRWIPAPDVRCGHATGADTSCEFLEEIRSAFPEAELVHNANWWVLPITDPLHRRQVQAADWVVIEHAFEDAGLTGGNGPVSFRAFLRHIDAVHRMGRRVVFDASGDSPEGRELLLSGYLMANEGGDLLSSEERTEPGELWSGFRLNLGPARGDRERWHGVWRRDFAGGTVLLSDPGSSPGRLPIRGRRISGDRVTSIVLGDREGAIVLRR